MWPRSAVTATCHASPERGLPRKAGPEGPEGKEEALVFKRRDPLGWGAWLREQVYPRSGFKRATRYVIHRMRRLPDQPHRIARGVFAGSLIGFLPLPGLQFVAAWAASRAINGNLLAALLATFNTNPVTTPFFAVLAMTLGHWILGIEKPLSWDYIRVAICGSTSRPSSPRTSPAGTGSSSSGTRFIGPISSVHWGRASSSA